MTLLVFWLIRGVNETLRATLPKVYEYHLEPTTLPSNDNELIAWGNRQPDILYFQTVRLQHEFIVQAYCQKNLSTFPIPTFNAEMGKRGYVAKGKYIKVDLTPYGQALALFMIQALMLGIGLCGIYWARRRGEPIPNLFE